MTDEVVHEIGVEWFVDGQRLGAAPAEPTGAVAVDQKCARWSAPLGIQLLIAPCAFKRVERQSAVGRFRCSLKQVGVMSPRWTFILQSLQMAWYSPASTSSSPNVRSSVNGIDIGCNAHAMPDATPKVIYIAWSCWSSNSCCRRVCYRTIVTRRPSPS